MRHVNMVKFGLAPFSFHRQMDCQVLYTHPYERNASVVYPCYRVEFARNTRFAVASPIWKHPCSLIDLLALLMKGPWSLNNHMVQVHSCFTQTLGLVHDIDLR